MSKIVLITGASGLIGKALIKSLLDQGYFVHTLTTQKPKTNPKSNVKEFYWNPIGNEIDLQSLEGVESIVNLAGAPIAQRWTKAAKNRITNSRVKSLEVLAHNIKTHNFPIKHLISASAIGIYANSITHYYEEKDTQFSSNSYLSSVVHRWGAAVRSFDMENLKVSILRIGIVLDAKKGALPKMIFPIRNYMGAVLGNGDQWQSWIHIEDLVALISHVLKLRIGGVFNAVAPNPVQQSEMTTAIGCVLKKPIVFPNVSESLLKLMLGEMSAIVLESQRVCAKKIQQTGFKFKFHEISAALKSLV